MGAGRQKTPFPQVPQLPSPSCRTCPLSRLHPALGGQHQWASLPSGFLLGSANGRHQQEMEEERIKSGRFFSPSILLIRLPWAGHSPLKLPFSPQPFQVPCSRKYTFSLPRTDGRVLVFLVPGEFAVFCGFPCLIFIESPFI